MPRRGEESPLRTPYNPKHKVTWMFNCGHDFKLLTPVDQSHKPIKTFPLKCPECVEMNEDKHKDQGQAARLKQETTQKAEEALRLEKGKTLQKASEEQEQ